VRLRTTGCAQFSQPELEVEVDEALPQSAVRPVLDWFTESARKGAVFAEGQTLQFGWMILSLFARNATTLGLREPLIGSFPMEFVDSVSQTIRDTLVQRFTAESVGLVDRVDFPSCMSPSWMCRLAPTSRVVVAKRERPWSSFTGWFLGCTDEAHDHDSKDQLIVCSTYEMALRVPTWRSFLALPVGTTVVLTEEAPPRLFFNESELHIAAESFLNGRALRRPDR